MTCVSISFFPLIKGGEKQLEWVKKYGTVFNFHEIFNRPAVLVADAKIIQEIALNNVYDYIKPSTGDSFAIVGNGLLTAEGEDHKRQRKLMSPAFTHSNVKVIILRWQKKNKI